MLQPTLNRSELNITNIYFKTVEGQTDGQTDGPWQLNSALERYDLIFKGLLFYKIIRVCFVLDLPRYRPAAV